MAVSGALTIGTVTVAIEIAVGGRARWRERSPSRRSVRLTAPR
jgi:hypothetical protein